MAYTREVTRVKQAGVTPSGRQVVRQKVQVSTSESVSDTLKRLVMFAFGAIEVLLLFRIVLKVLGANPGSTFVSFIYNTSMIFEYPFRGIFPAGVQEGIVVTSVLEPSSIVAVLVYAVIAVAIEGLIGIMSRSSEE